MPGPRLIDLGDPVADHPLNYGLVAWWLGLPNTSGGGTLFDLVRQPGYDGTLTNGPTRTPDPSGFGGVAVTSGSSQYVGNTTLPVLAPPFAAAVWGKWSRTATASGIAGSRSSSAGSGWGLRFEQPASANVVGVTYFGVADYATSIACPTDWCLIGLSVPAWTTPTVEVYSPAGWATQTLSAGTPTAANLTGFVLGTDYRSNAPLVPAQGVLGSGWAWNRAGIDFGRLYEQSLRGHPDTLRRYTPRAWVFGGTAPAGGGNRRRRVLLCGGG